MTTAHELAERGFDVTIYERRAWGGKARSFGVPGTGSPSRAPLPAEHGFRVEFGFYQNLPDTMRRIPFAGNPNGVFDNMIEAPLPRFARAGKHDLLFPIGGGDAVDDITPEDVAELLPALLLESNLPPQGLAQFVRCLLIYMSSCDERRHGQWENVRWTDFVGGDRWGKDFHDLIVAPWSEYAQATKSEVTAAQFPAHVWELIVYSMLGRGTNGSTMRMLDRPTNEAWIDPWMRELRRLGVRPRIGTLKRFEFRGGRIRGAVVRRGRRTQHVVADHYVSALPVEIARRFWTRGMLIAEPALQAMDELTTSWENGVQLYLNTEVRVAGGLLGVMDSTWKISGANYSTLWRNEISRYGDGGVKDILSMILSDWETPGRLNGKRARDCSERELVREIWEELKAHVNDTGTTHLRDEMLVGWQVDPGLVRRPGGGFSANRDPLVEPRVGSYRHRPAPETEIPNLFLAGDYLDGDWEVANMECANCNGRRAANAVLDAAGSRESRAHVLDSYRPPEWEQSKRLDADRYKRGQPNLFDAELTARETRDLLRTSAKG